jgi:hypothetical protein
VVLPEYGWCCAAVNCMHIKIPRNVTNELAGGKSFIFLERIMENFA